LTALGHIARLWVACMAGLLATAGVASAYPAFPTSVGPSLAPPELVASTPPGNVRGIGSDGLDGVWFADEEFGSPHNTAYMAHYSPRGGGLTRVTLPIPDYSYSYIAGIAPGLHGEVWFGQTVQEQLSHITASGTLVSKVLPSMFEPTSVAVDKSGNVWFTNNNGCKLGRLSSTGKLAVYPVGSECTQMTVGPDGNIWLALYPSNEVKELSATTGAVLATYSLRYPIGIATVGQYVMVTEIEPGVVARIGPSGDVIEYDLPKDRKLDGATAGPDGSLWFTESEGPTGEGAIGRITSSGALSEVPIPDGGGAAGIAATNDGVYFTYDNSTTGNGVMRIPLSNIATPDEASYVALGDSYSSGEGNPPYEPESDNVVTLDTCHRAQQAYGPLVDGALTLGPMIFKACSGAVTDDIFNPNGKNYTEPAQLDWLRPQDTAVTLTIGGDDGGFVELLEHCVAGIRPGPNFQPFGCEKDKALRAKTEARRKALANKGNATTPEGRPIHSILSVIEAIHAESHAPNARIVIGGYPKLFGTETANYENDSEAPSGLVCRVGTAFVGGVPFYENVDYFDALWLDALSTKLDAAIKEAVADAQAEGIPARYANPKFKGHGLCDSGASWLHALDLNEENETEKSSFHPNVSGQQLGYASAFKAQLK
jgi:streptogramin lyase